MRPDLRRRRLLLLLATSTLYTAPLARRALAEAARPSLSGTQAPASDAGKGLKVVVVGAGMAGLSAAATLVATGAEVVVLEARDRIGGRIFTDRSLGVPVEQGANFIHGFNGNPVAALASKAGGMPFFVDEEQSAVLLSGGEEPEDFEIDDLWEEIERIEEKAAEEADGDAALSLLDIIELLDPALLQEPIGNWGLTDMWENELGAPLSAISALHFNSGEVYPGPDAVLLQGYDFLPRHLADGLDIRLGEAVRHVRHAGDTVTVETATARFEADHCVVAVPLGVLKAGAIAFDPPLPPEHQAAIAAIGFGNLAKVSVLFDRVFWPTDLHYLGYAGKERGRFADMLSLVPIHDAPVLTLMASGDYADKVDAMDEAALRADVTAVLRDMFGQAVPAPEAITRHAWSTDPLALGTYSYPAVGARPGDHDVLAGPASGRLLLAGEHTSRDHFGTVHGALESGQRAALAVLKRGRG